MRRRSGATLLAASPLGLPAESLLPGTHILYQNHREADEVFRLIDYR